MKTNMKFLHSLLLLFLLSTSVRSSCNELLSHAFQSVINFNINSINLTTCTELKLPLKNLTGTVSWMVLHNISTLRHINLSGNSLEGSIPGAFWSNNSVQTINLAGNHLGGALRLGPAGSLKLKTVDVSGNRFTSAAVSRGFGNLEVVDFSNNNLIAVPTGLERLKGLKYLDLSNNSIAGVFNLSMANFRSLRFLNLSYNDFSGVVESGIVRKFGKAAFIHAGSLTFVSKPHRALAPAPTHNLASQTQKPKNKSRKNHLKIGIAVSVSILLALTLTVCIVCVLTRRRKKEAKKESNYKDKEPAAVDEVRWVTEGKHSAPVVMLEKPLMELTFGELVKATSGFGKESQLAETSGRSGLAFRAVLRGEMNVVVRVVASAREMEERAAVEAFRDLGRLRHPNVLPLLGYCIPGKEKLLIYEYMERGDLHRFLHELPSDHPNETEDWTNDTWDNNATKHTNTTLNWPTRHRIALGIARGLAFLHQARGNTAHGHLVATNILITENLEARISDYGLAEGGTVEGDVYDYGVVVMELVTGMRRWNAMDVAKVREFVRTGKAVDVVDLRIREEEEDEREATECLKIGYLCTAPVVDKRPTMQQVVGLIKEIRRDCE